LKTKGYAAVAITGEGQKYPGKYDLKEEELFDRLRNPELNSQIKYIYMTAEKLSNWLSAKKFEKLLRLTKVNRQVLPPDTFIARE